MTTESRSAGHAKAGEIDRPHPLSSGYRLSEFELLEVIGEGGFGIVYRAYDHSLHREVAIKEYMPAMLAHRVGDNSVHVRSARRADTFRAGLRGFINEARTLAQFSHPALLKVHRFWEANATAYMATQLYRGRTLRALLDETQGRPSEADMRQMLGPLLGALETLHRSSCFHRDIAPDNILLQDDGMAVLLDFGAARKSIADVIDEVAVMVKSGYSPIEQYADDSALQQGPWTDLYALGAVIYRALTGAPPPSAVVRSVEDNHVPLAALGRNDLSAEFCAAVDRTLAVNIKDRTQSVADFAEALDMVRVGDAYLSRRDASFYSTATDAAAIEASAPAHAMVDPHDVSDVTPSSASSNGGGQGGGAAPPVAMHPPQTSEPTGGASAVGMSATRRPGRGGLWVWAASLLLLVVVSWGLWRTFSGESGAPVPVDVSSAPQISTPNVTASPPVAPVANAPEPSASAAVTSAPEPAASASAGGAAVAPPLASPASAPMPSTGAVVPPLEGATAGPQNADPPAAASSASVPGTGAVGGEAAIVPAPANPEMAATPGSTSTVTTVTVDEVEAESWRRAEADGTAAAYRTYVRRYPRGQHVREARTAIAEINRRARADAALMAGDKSSTVAGPSAVSAGSGRLVLNIRPWGQVFVNGVDRGVSPPLKVLTLAAGSHLVEIRNGDLPVYRQRVIVSNNAGGGHQTVAHEFK